MNYAIPVLVCHQVEDFRSHLREMLTKHGFFHVIEASTLEEMKLFLNQEKKFFAIIHSDLVDTELMNTLNESPNRYLFLTQPDSAKTLQLAVKMGVGHLLSFPFSSQQLVERMIHP